MHILYVQTLRKKSSGNNAQPVIIVLTGQTYSIIKDWNQNYEESKKEIFG